MAVLTIELEKLEARFSADPDVDIASLDAYQRGVNSLRRLLETLAAGLSRRPRDVTEHPTYMAIEYEKYRQTSIIEAIADKNLFADHFPNPQTWTAWRAFLATLFGHPMDADELELYRKHTGRQAPPTKAYDEAWLVCGRRGGKSRILALIAVYLACFRDYRPYLASGEVGTVRLMAVDRDQARAIFRFIAGFLRETPALKRLVARETADSFELTNRTIIEVGTASFRSSRGYTFIAVLADEIAFWRSDESTNPDTEILRALRPGLLTIPGAKLLCASVVRMLAKEPCGRRMIGTTARTTPRS